MSNLEVTKYSSKIIFEPKHLKTLLKMMAYLELALTRTIDETVGIRNSFGLGYESNGIQVELVLKNTVANGKAEQCSFLTIHYPTKLSLDDVTQMWFDLCLERDFPCVLVPIRLDPEE